MTAAGGMPRAYSLMYVSGQARDGAYLQALAPERRMRVYLRMALRLARGVARAFGAPLTLLTNDEGTLVRVLDTRGFEGWRDALHVARVEFGESLIPRGAHYFSATHKVYLFDHLAAQPGYSLLLDLDMVCLRPPSPALQRLVAAGVPVVYDISDQVFQAHGFDRFMTDFEKFGRTDPGTRWYGGEFLGGPPAFFAELGRRARAVLPRYAEVISTLKHQGDEAITTHCLNEMRAAWPFVDVGALGIVRRHHGKATLHDEKRLGRGTPLEFVHLPTSKALLASGCSDAAVMRVLRAAEYLPRRPAGWLIAGLGRLASAALRGVPG